jgi:RNA recognition motif-containing protein
METISKLIEAMSQDDSRKLFVAGLSDSVTEDVLRALCEAAGANAVDISIPKDRATGRPRGFGFVTLESEEHATIARDALDGAMQGDRPLSVRPFRSEGRPERGDRPPPRGDARGGPPGDRPMRGPAGNTDDRTLYIGNLPYEATREGLEGWLSTNGVEDVERVHLPLNELGKARGFGFVTLRSAESAAPAVEQLNQQDFGGRPISVSVARGRGDRPPPGAPRGVGDRGPRPERRGPPGAGPGGGGPSGGGGPPMNWGEEQAFLEARRSGRRKDATKAVAGGDKDKKRKKRRGASASSSGSSSTGGEKEFRSPRNWNDVEAWDDD